MTLSILQRVASGDADAVQDCISQYGALIWSLARRLSHTISDAEDATQEIFLQIWRQAARFDDSRSSEVTFIAMIARRRLINRRRQSIAQRQMDSSKVLELAAWSGTNSGNVTSDCKEVEQAKQALAQLGGANRQVLALGVLQGLNHVEIARRLDMTLETVKSNMRRGLLQVRECINTTATEAVWTPP